ncbi:MAG TPA: amidohydrolase family protein [Thermomicrobiales bacterium]|nr:amidohydrolase family protein [Thermomicrobiales bacterium]
MTDSQQPRRIDSHFHFWDPATRDYPWMPPDLKRAYGPADLRPLLAANGFDAAILVQTVSEVEETREFLQIAADNDIVAGVVGWVDLIDPQMPSTLDDIVHGENGKYLVGLRHQVHDEDDPDWLLQETVQRNLEAIAGHGIVYDLLVRTRELPSAITVARDFPHLRFVVDHIAKPPIASGEIDDWAALMREFAALGNVACKLSGMVTEADPAGWTPEDLTPYVATVVEIFGPERLMFGSDWPVCTLAASYDQVVAAARTVLTDLGVLDEAAEATIFGDTATHWYNLNAIS